MKKIIWLAIVMFVCSCSQIKTYYSPNKIGDVYIARAGEKMLRVDITQDLVNAFGKADLFGGKVNKGFIEIKYHGFDEKKNSLLFSIFEQEIKTSESTMTRYGQDRVNYSGNSYSNYNTWGNQLNSQTSSYGTATITKAPEAIRENLPPNTYLIDLRYPQDNLINLGKQHYIKIIEVSSDKSKVKFQVHEGQIQENF